MPGLGGLAILAAAVVAGLIFLPANQETRGILAGAVAIALIGAVDDARPNGLHPLVKLAGQFARGGHTGLVRRARRERDAALHRPARSWATGATR